MRIDKPDFIEELLGDDVDIIDASIDAIDLDIVPFDVFDETPVQTKRQLNAPLRQTRKVAKRRHIANMKRQNLSALIPSLPEPDELLYVVGNGDGREGRMGAMLETTGFDYGSFVPVLAGMFGTNVHCYISTWVMNADHARAFIDMLDDGRLRCLYLLTDPYFKTKPSTAPIANTLIEAFARFPGRARFMAFNNHTKILCMSDASGQRFVTVTGSSNLTAVARAEQYVLDGSPETYHFFVSQFFEPMLAKES